MKQTSEPIVFFGNERIATGVTTTTPILRSLLEAGYPIAAVVANHEAARSRNARSLEVAALAAEYDIPVLLPERPKDILEELRSYGAVAGVLVAYGRIIPQSVIDIFPRGIINIHPSLLPKHRGPTPLESVILDGSAVTGVSIMELAKEMDAGPVYAQSEYELTGTETKQQLADDLSEIGSAMLLEILPGILDGSVVALPQGHDAATYDKLISRNDGVLDCTKPAAILEREVRAYAQWPKSRLRLGTTDVVVTAAAVAELGKATPGKLMPEKKRLFIGTGQDWLEVLRLKPAGKAEMTAEAFLNGYGKDL